MEGNTHIFAHYNIKIIIENHSGVVHITQEITLIFFPNLSSFWPYDVILIPKTALFEHNKHSFADFNL